MYRRYVRRIPSVKAGAIADAFATIAAATIAIAGALAQLHVAPQDIPDSQQKVLLDCQSAGKLLDKKGIFKSVLEYLPACRETHVA